MMFFRPVDPRLAEFLREHRHDKGDILYQLVYVATAIMQTTSVYNPFSPAEKALSDQMVSMARTVFDGKWYHGGRAGRLPGEELLSASRGVPLKATRDLPAAARRFVYLSPMKSYAMWFAEHSQGSLYEVAPDETLGVAHQILRSLRLMMSWEGDQILQHCLPLVLSEFSCRSAKVIAVCPPEKGAFSFVDDSLEAH